MHARLAEAMDFVEDKRRDLLASVEGVPAEDLTRHSAGDAWSVAEILDHLRMVESGVARIITKRVKQAKDAGIAEENSTESVIPSFEPYRLKLESVKITSPEAVRPKPNADPLRLWKDSLSRARHSVKQRAPRTEWHWVRSSTPTPYSASSTCINGLFFSDNMRSDTASRSSAP